MNTDRARAFLLALPHVSETMQWGDNLLFWLGDKAIGGKMFALISLSGGAAGQAAVSYLAGPERFADLVEQDGLRPAPYFARIFWVAANTWQAHRDPVWEDEFREAHRLTWAKLAPKTREILDLPAAEQKRLLTARKRLLAARERARKQAQPAPAAKPVAPRRSKAAEAADLAAAARAARPKKHRQS